MRKLLILSSICAGVLIVCLYTPTLLRMPEEQAARQLAKKAAHERGMKFVRVAGVKRVGDHWIIQVESFPPSFGGHASVEISESKVIKYRPGK